jgi:hypothetical protein
MKKANCILKIGKAQAAICSLLLILCLTVPSYSRVDESVFQTEYHKLDGVTTSNNVAFVSDRYILAAPYAPSKPVTEDTRDLSELDNNKLYIFDGKRTDKEPYIVDLKSCYYPTRVVFDAAASMVFLRGTQIVEDPATGEYVASAVIKYLPLSEDGKITSLEALTIPIQGVDGLPATDAPDTFVQCDNNIFIFTNGAGISTYDTRQGYLYEVPFITRDNYHPENNTITSLDFDSKSRVLSIVISKKTKLNDTQWKHESELYLYNVRSNGTVDQLNHIPAEEFGDAALAPGSNIFIDGEIDKSGNNIGNGYFVTNTGKLCQISWEGLSARAGQITELASFDEFKQGDSEYLSSVKTYFDKANRSFRLLRNGSATNIHRPINAGRGKIGKIHRPINFRIEVEQPALGLIQFGKKNKIIGQRVLSDEIAGEGGASDLFTDDTGTVYLATYSGKFFTLNQASEVDGASLKLVGQIGNRLSSVSYLAARNAIIAVNTLEAEGSEIASPGGIYLAKHKESGNYISFVSWTENLLAGSSVLGFSSGSIRRPCNTRPQ